MTQIRLSGEEIDLLKKIENERRCTIRKKKEKEISYNLNRSGLISLEKNTKATYVITDPGRKKLQLSGSKEVEASQSIDFTLITQRLDDLKSNFKEVLQGYQDELKSYINMQLKKQNEAFLAIMKPEKEKTIDEDTFLGIIRDEYTTLKQESPISPYVSIKLLRDFVCKRSDLDKDNFDVMLLSIANKDPYTVQLSASSGEHGTGIIYGRSECHAAIIK